MTEEQQRRLGRRPTTSLASKQDERWPSAVGLGQERTEVGVGRYQHPALLDGAIEDREVVGAAEPEICHVDRIVAGVGEERDEASGEVLVEQKPHLVGVSCATLRQPRRKPQAR